MHDEPLSKDDAALSKETNEAEKQRTAEDGTASDPVEIAVETVPQISIVNAPPVELSPGKSETCKPTKSDVSTGMNHSNEKALDEVCNICSKNVSPAEAANGTTHGLYVQKTGWIRCDG